MTADRPLGRRSLPVRLRRGLDHALGTTSGKVVILALLAAYAWWAAGVRTFTWPARLLTGVPGLLLVLLGFLTPGVRHPTRTSGLDARHHLGTYRARRRAGLDVDPAAFLGGAAWSLVVCAALAWELYAYTHGPRGAYPTLSSVIGELERNHIARTLALMLWVVAGWDLLHH
jgi:hypothetical protein